MESITRKKAIYLGLMALASSIPTIAHAGLFGNSDANSDANHTSAHFFGTDETNGTGASDGKAELRFGTDSSDGTEVVYFLTSCSYYSDGLLTEKDVLEYDEHGNNTVEIDYLYNEDGSLGDARGVVIHYDEDGMPLSEDFVYDDNGNRIVLSSWDFEAFTDVNGMVVELRLDESVRRFEYDDAGTMRVRTVQTSADNYIITRFDDHGFVIEKEWHFQGADPTLPNATQLRYVRNEAGEITDMYVSAKGSEEETHYLCICDENGNVVEVYDESMALVRAMEWQAFKNPPIYTKWMDHNWFAYTLA